ncbi:hypothetical protein F8S09_11155 [Deinococcus sp. SDU3-2]|uniref:LPS export ABC transporter periplasmic protein LptC n=1 Tax=Deinococcus terrestris TaxID=2651870 RepID=A0A7X1NXN3_9DEIO|nr:hypothetical protein [Deinococcus terrestris]MPY67244.1 hypothetical protein [Deinococcus terrestris]
MLRTGVYALVALAVFALVFSRTPPSQAGPDTGARLSDVQLSLYPARDPGAVWRFSAERVVSDPLRGETRLTGLADGGRWLRPQGGGAPVLDATLDAPDLTIDTQDNLLTRQAQVTLVQQCADIDLRGTRERPVRVEQGSGFSAPVAQVDSPSLVARLTNLRMTFDFQIEEAGEDSTFEGDLDAAETCENGRRIPL